MRSLVGASAEEPCSLALEDSVGACSRGGVRGLVEAGLLLYVSFFTGRLWLPGEGVGLPAGAVRLPFGLPAGLLKPLRCAARRSKLDGPAEATAAAGEMGSLPPSSSRRLRSIAVGTQVPDDAEPNRGRISRVFCLRLNGESCAVSSW